MLKPNMIDDIGSLRIKCINLESAILVLKKELVVATGNASKYKEEIECIKAEKNACLAGNKYYGDKAVVLQDKINRAIDVLMELIQNDQIEEQASNILKEKYPTISSKTTHYHHESYCRKCGLTALE